MKQFISLILSLIFVLALIGCGNSRIEAETVQFHDKTFTKSDLSQETLEWLERYNELSEDEQLAISYIPNDLYNLCGYESTNELVATRDNFSITSASLSAEDYVCSQDNYSIESGKDNLIYSMNWAPTGQSVSIGFMSVENNSMYLGEAVEGGSAFGTITTDEVPAGEYYVVIFAASDNTEPFSINATCEWGDE